ncbi:hypothetical protein D3C72_1807890 [compost metagenome]
MGDLGAGLGGDQRGNAGVTEEVEDFQGAAGGLHLILHPAPVGELLGKHADMAEGGEAAMEVRAEKLHRPGLAKNGAGKAPAAHAVLVGVAGKDRVRVLPHAVGQGTRPERLRLGAHDPVRSVLLELFAGAAVDQMIAGNA